MWLSTQAVFTVEVRHSCHKIQCRYLPELGEQGHFTKRANSIIQFSIIRQPVLQGLNLCCYGNQFLRSSPVLYRLRGAPHWFVLWEMSVSAALIFFISFVQNHIGDMPSAVETNSVSSLSCLKPEHFDQWQTEAHFFIFRLSLFLFVKCLSLSICQSLTVLFEKWSELSPCYDRLDYFSTLCKMPPSPDLYGPKHNLVTPLLDLLCSGIEHSFQLSPNSVYWYDQSAYLKLCKRTPSESIAIKHLTVHRGWTQCRTYMYSILDNKTNYNLTI